MESRKINEEDQAKDAVLVNKGLIYYIVALVKLIIGSIFFCINYFFCYIVSKIKFIGDGYVFYCKNKKFNKSLYAKSPYNEEIL